MLRPAPERQRWKLRSRLLLPMIALVLLGAIGLAVMGGVVVGDQAESLVGLHGDSVLAGLEAQLHDRQRSKEVFAELMAEESGVAFAVQESDKVGLARLMVPRQAKLGLGHIVVRTSSGQELLRLGARDPGVELDALATSALSGLTKSVSGVGDRGLEVWASAPIKGSTGIVGAMMVGVTLDEDALRAIGAQQKADLAVYRGGTLVATSVDRVGLRSALRESGSGPEGMEALRRKLAGFDIQPAARQVVDDGAVLALISTQDVNASAGNLKILILLGGLALMLAVAVVGRGIARDVVLPLESMVRAAGDIVEGRYRNRVGSSNIKELDELAGSFNYLAEQLDLQVTELARQAFHDSLTKLPNRMLFMERLAQALRRADRRPHVVTLLFLDLDNFKVVNDSLGHCTGDELLIAVADRLKLCLRGEDTAARLGGDEFTVLLEGVGGVTEAIRVADRIQSELQEPFNLGGHEVFATASIGIALNTGNRERAEALLRDADLAMYRAKANGRARYELFDPALSAQVVERLKVETDLRHAVERGELRLYYQPVIRLDTGEVAALEALIRWVHPERGLLMPADFSPLAEESGLITSIGRWVMEEGCRQMKKWQSAFPADPPLRVCVNLSTRQFQNPRLDEEIEWVLNECELGASDLELEITESVMIRDFEATLSTLQQLKGLGIRLAVDDFGTGYSSLAYLKRFPVDVLKIDRAFVGMLGPGAQEQDESIVRAVIAFAKALNLTVTAEGVETIEQLALLRDLGCDYAQGHYFCKAVPPDQATEMLAESPAWVSCEGTARQGVRL